MDTKFSVALHVLTMISESEKTLSSEDLARRSAPTPATSAKSSPSSKSQTSSAPSAANPATSSPAR